MFILHMKENIHNTTQALKAEVDQFKMDHLKLSASVSSLELFRKNQTNIKCGEHCAFVIVLL